MSIYAYEAQETWLPTVAGLTCSDIHVQEALLQIHFGDLLPGPDDTIDAERTISMYGVWRVQHQDTIIAGSGDLDETSTSFALELLKNVTLERFDVARPGFDLTLHFSGGVMIRSFPCDSNEFEENIEEETDFPISWWVDGLGVTDDWEEPYDAHGV